MSEAQDQNEAVEAVEQPQEQPQVRLKVVTFVVFAFKTSTSGIKAPVDNDDAGKAIMKDVRDCINGGQPYFNEERGILINPSELSHVFLAQEQVQQ